MLKQGKKLLKDIKNNIKMKLNNIKNNTKKKIKI